MNLYRQQKPDLMVLDMALPDTSGFQVISEIRKIDPITPVILMTDIACDDEVQVRAYQLGVINLMQKPLVPQALLALIRHILSLRQDMRVYHLEDCCIRLHGQVLEINGHKETMRPKDALVLAYLLQHHNQVVSRATLLQQIWLNDQYKVNNLLDGAICRIRHLFKDYPAITIRTVYGDGYLLGNKRYESKAQGLRQN